MTMSEKNLKISNSSGKMVVVAVAVVNVFQACASYSTHIPSLSAFSKRIYTFFVHNVLRQKVRCR